MTILTETIAKTIWDLKYRYRIGNNKIIDQTIEDTWRRVAKAVALAEVPKLRSRVEQEFYSILEGFRFLPGGRILAGAGTKHRVTLFNCFVMNIKEDSLPGIFKALEEGAVTLQRGGGVGYDFSVLRPKGDMAHQTGVPASGPISFMRIWDRTCEILLSTGARRGAMMGVLRCDHPDILEFITAKENPRELRHFNVSVMISDAFMEAVKNDTKWPLVFPTDVALPVKEMVYRQWGNSTELVPCRVYTHVKARDLWDKIMRSAYDYAEPGVLFVDTINRLNNLWYRERINATNPCGEIPLPAYGACNLGAINLTQFIASPFSKNAQIKWDDLRQTVKIATRFLDNVIDVSHYPLRVQRQEAVGTRRIGLGITGLGDALVMLGIHYGSPQSIATARDLMKQIAEATWQTSIELAREKGPFPYFKSDYLRGEFVKNLDGNIRHELTSHAVRNSHHNTIAPAGTISLLANNISNGIEPIFLPHYHRHVRMMNGTASTFHVIDYAFKLWQRENHSGLPAAWIDTNTLLPEAHLAMQAAVQPYIDNAISKTINIPKNFPFKKLMDVYTQAYQAGLKGCTVFRANPVTGSVLEEEHPRKKQLDQCCQDEDV